MEVPHLQRDQGATFWVNIAMRLLAKPSINGLLVSFQIIRCAYSDRKVSYGKKIFPSC